MRRLAIKFILFWGMLEGLAHLSFEALAAGMALILAAIACTHFIFRTE